MVDDGPLALLAKHFEPSMTWPAGLLEVVQSVAAGAVSDKSGRTQRLLAAQASDGPVIAVNALTIGTVAADLVLRYLRCNEASADKNLGEDESIAFCMENSDAVFVTMDKRAAYIALAELGPGRVVTPFDLWTWLATEGLLGAQARAALDEATLKKGGLPGVPRRLRGTP